jgi:hypothetical protein
VQHNTDCGDPSNLNQDINNPTVTLTKEDNKCEATTANPYPDDSKIKFLLKKMYFFFLLLNLVPLIETRCRVVAM